MADLITKIRETGVPEQFVKPILFEVQTHLTMLITDPKIEEVVRFEVIQARSYKATSLHIVRKVLRKVKLLIIDSMEEEMDHDG